MRGGTGLGRADGWEPVGHAGGTAQEAAGCRGLMLRRGNRTGGRDLESWALRWPLNL